MLRTVFGLAVLVVLVLFLDWSFLAGLSAKQYTLSALVVIALVACTWFEAARLYALCQGGVDRMELFRVVLIAYFVTNFTPSSFGGDGYKVYALGRSLGYPSATALVLLERSMGLFILLAVAALAVLVHGDQWASHVVGMVRAADLPGLPGEFSLWALALLVVVFVAALWPWRVRLVRFAHSFWLTVSRLPLKSLMHFFVMTMCLHVIRAALLCMQLAVLNYDLNMPQAWVVLTIAAVASMVPVSPGGLGVREAAMVVALAPFNVDYQVALFVALVMRLANVGQAVLGALLLPGGRQGGRVAMGATDAR